MDGTLKLAEITKKGLKLPYPVKNCYQVIEDFGEVMRASVNSVGKFICLSVANAGLAPDPRVYLWDAANDKVTNKLICKHQSPPYQSVPIAIVWDANDPRILAVHMRSADSDNIHLLFCHEGSLYEYKHWRPKDENLFTSDFTLCFFSVPYVVTISQQVVNKIMIEDFKEYPEVDQVTLRQLLDFLYYMTIGNLEKAIIMGSNVSGGNNTSIWDSLANVCVTLKKPDVGAICLSKKGDIKGALMLRKAINDQTMDCDCKVGVLALNIGMVEEAEALFRGSKRHDFVNKLIAAKKGGLHELINASCEGENILLVKSAQHKLAKEMWANGDVNAAVKLFESAGTLVPYVPRMMVMQGQAGMLAQYVAKSSDPKLIMWWGHYLESIGELDGALEAYVRASDFGEQIRLLCHMERIEEAEKLCYKDTAALYQMARYLEIQPDKTEEAVKVR